MTTAQTTIDTMSVDPETEARLLAAVRDATSRAEAIQKQAQRMVSESAAERKAAIQAAMDAHIARDAIATAANVNRVRLYQILKAD